MQTIYHIVCVRRCNCDTLSMKLFTDCWLEPSKEFIPEGMLWPFDQSILAIFFLRNSNTFKVRMCILELKRAKSTIPLECIRDSSTLTALKTSAQLFFLFFLFFAHPLWQTHSLSNFCERGATEEQVMGNFQQPQGIWAAMYRGMQYRSSSDWRRMIKSIRLGFGVLQEKKCPKIEDEEGTTEFNSTVTETIMQNCNLTATKGIKLKALVILKLHCAISHLLFSPMKLSIRFSLRA